MLAYVLFSWVKGSLDVSFLFVALIFLALWFYLVIAVNKNMSNKAGDQHFHNHFEDTSEERKVNDPQV